MRSRTKRTRIIVYSVITALSILMVVGILLLIFDDTSAQATLYEIIAFVVGMAGMIMAVLAEIDASRQERENQRMVREINRLADDESEDTEILKQILAKLNENNRGKKK